ncbi:hypothetical protein EVAR_67933_1 [Eumeta japonica]|uniref:Uncharacterized protein n=1 Tax=Eumeta variegata TaxID=151549 RepID=A0A4C1ZR45_EUMVA|nr:hypothetical protein EVAR_67933_1 [Eumeta japonica]
MSCQVNVSHPPRTLVACEAAGHGLRRRISYESLRQAPVGPGPAWKVQGSSPSFRNKEQFPRPNRDRDRYQNPNFKRGEPELGVARDRRPKSRTGPRSALGVGLKLQSKLWSVWNKDQQRVECSERDCDRERDHDLIPRNRCIIGSDGRARATAGNKPVSKSLTRRCVSWPIHGPNTKNDHLTMNDAVQVLNNSVDGQAFVLSDRQSGGEFNDHQRKVLELLVIGQILEKNPNTTKPG